MNVGLPQGFVRFGTLHEKLLKLALEDKIISNRSARLHMRELNLDPRGVSVAIRQLLRARMLFKVGNERPYKQRSYAVFALDYRVKMVPKQPPVPAAERTRVYRERKSKMVSSVFNWRGTHEISR